MVRKLGQEGFSVDGKVSSLEAAKADIEGFFTENDKSIELEGRSTALKRSFENIIQNGLTYGNKVNVHISH